jgi:hypothetical protein
MHVGEGSRVGFGDVRQGVGSDVEPQQEGCGWKKFD